MTLKSKTLLETGLYLDLQVDADCFTCCTYAVIPKDQHLYRDSALISSEAFTGEDVPIAFAAMPAIQHGTPLKPAHYSDHLFVNGDDVGVPDCFLLRQSQITFKFMNGKLMRKNQAEVYSNWYLPINGAMFGKPYNWYVKSYIGKDSGEVCPDQALAQVSSPYFNAPMSECAIRLNIDPRYGYRSNVSFDNEVAIDDGGVAAFIQQTMPTVSFAASTLNIPAGDTISVPFEVKDRVSNGYWAGDFVAFLECTGGYLPMQRVNTVNGVGEFKVTALGLSAGDEFKVKIGARYYTGINEINFLVV
ncbi:hypothetical protein N9112_00030 [bacterium]|nr:hypothetical protein [bacterium]